MAKSSNWAVLWTRTLFSSANRPDFSAQDAAAGIGELVRAGRYPVQDILGGAAATGVPVANAATIAAQSLNAFHKSAADLTGVVDDLAGVSQRYSGQHDRPAVWCSQSLQQPRPVVASPGSGPQRPTLQSVGRRSAPHGFLRVRSAQ